MLEDVHAERLPASDTASDLALRLLAEIKSRKTAAAQQDQFELAAKYRDLIDDVERISERLNAILG